ncbi:hypothetical protein Pth03_10680 [Planotetraspora thailandica]|uniref:Uncharacterized protein n=1 Tax=Planotetraspora thailandica TaxID=487172 RepID=A0A8J3V273_9ACTN|nr:hypothetical protein [Planotetraspora thailandica]GII52679.1 hypothetical protein Pth03_10680 [Planotetraspora thailandica]
MAKRKTAATGEKPDRLGVIVGAIATVIAAILTGVFTLLAKDDDGGAKSQPSSGAPKEIVQWEGSYTIESGTPFTLGTGAGQPPTDQSNAYSAGSSSTGDFALETKGAGVLVAAKSYGSDQMNLKATGGGRLTRWVFEGKPGRDDCAGLLDRDLRTVVEGASKDDVLCGVTLLKNIVRIEVVDESQDSLKARVTVWEPRVPVTNSPTSSPTP